MQTKHELAFPAKRLGALIGLAARQWRRTVDMRLQAFNLTEATWLPLLRLSEADGPIRQKELAEILALDTSSVVRLLRNLESVGLIEQREDEEDRRAKALRVTERGRALVRRVEAASLDVEDEILQDVDPTELVVMRRVLEQICRRLSSVNDGTEGS